MSKQYDAIIIGAGIIGAAIGLELARRGWKTLNVDKQGAAGFGSTSNSSAIIRTYYSTLDGTAMAYEGYHYWRDWAKYIGVEDESGWAKFRECGCLVMKTEENGYLAKAMQLAKELGIPYTELQAEQIQTYLPGADLQVYAPAKRPEQEGFAEPTGGALQGAVYWPRGGYVTDPQLATHNLQRAAESVGGEFRFYAEVVAIRQVDGRICGVSLKNGEQLDAPVVVNVAGPHSSKINALVGLNERMKMSTRALRQEIPYVTPPQNFDYAQLGMITSDSDIATYSRPASGGMMLLGSEDPDCDVKAWVDVDEMDRNLTEQAMTQIIRMAQRLPELGIPNQVRGVVEAYDVTEDWIPIYDKTDIPGYYLAIGTSGNQFKNTAVVGKMMATLITACEAGQDHDQDPVQYRLEYLERTVSMGFYSRNREINQDSSFSVLG